MSSIRHRASQKYLTCQVIVRTAGEYINEVILTIKNKGNQKPHLPPPPHVQNDLFSPEM